MIRRAAAGDIDALVDNAKSLWTEIEQVTEFGEEWEPNARSFLKNALTNDHAVAYVADGPPIVASGLGIVMDMTPSIWVPTGKMGYVQWFYTQPAHRGKGYGSEILDGIMQWMREQKVARVQLHAADSALPLYERGGFVPTKYANYWWGF